MQSIRTAKGLAYSVGGGIGSSFDHPGVVRLSMGTKSASTVEAIQALYEELDKLKTNPISDDEIKRAKDSILNSFVFNFDSPDKVLRERMAYEFYGYPADFLERFRSAVEKVQAADVARVAAKYLHKDQLAVLVVGNASEFDKPLSTLGEVKNIDITIPPPPAEKEEAPAAKPTASNPEGKALAAKVVDAMGGLAKLQSVKSLQSDLTEKDAEGGPSTAVQVTIVFPDSMHVDVQTPQGALAIVVTPDAGFMSAAGMGVRDLPPPQKAETVQQIHRDLIFIGQHLNDPAFIFAAGGTETIGGVETQNRRCQRRRYGDPLVCGSEDRPRPSGSIRGCRPIRPDAWRDRALRLENHRRNYPARHAQEQGKRKRLSIVEFTGSSTTRRSTPSYLRNRRPKPSPRSRFSRIVSLVGVPLKLVKV